MREGEAGEGKLKTRPRGGEGRNKGGNEGRVGTREGTREETREGPRTYLVKEDDAGLLAAGHGEEFANHARPFPHVFLD